MTNIIAATPANLVVDASVIVADANTVVLNDIAEVSAETVDTDNAVESNTAPTVSDEASAANALNDLIQQRVNWQAGSYQRSNAELYVVLQRCYAIYNAMCESKPVNEAWNMAISAYLTKEGIAVKKTTHTLTKIARCVFGGDRRRISAYGIALRAAYAAKVTVADLPQYIADSNGVEELRLAKTGNSLSLKQKAERGQTAADRVTHAEVKIDSLGLDGGKIGTKHLLIVTQAANGALIINGMVSAEGVVNAALAAYYSANKADIAAASEVQAQRDVETQRDDAIAAAVQSMQGSNENAAAVPVAA